MREIETLIRGGDCSVIISIGDWANSRLKNLSDSHNIHDT
jgi:hypothetical protein